MLRRLCGACAEQPVGYGRKRFALVALDGKFRVSAVAPLLTHLISARNDAGTSDLGIGVASMSGFSGTFKALQVSRSALHSSMFREKGWQPASPQSSIFACAASRVCRRKNA